MATTKGKGDVYMRRYPKYMENKWKVNLQLIAIVFGLIAFVYYFIELEDSPYGAGGLFLIITGLLGGLILIEVAIFQAIKKTEVIFGENEIRIENGITLSSMDYATAAEALKTAKVRLYLNRVEIRLKWMKLCFYFDVGGKAEDRNKTTACYKELQSRTGVKLPEVTAGDIVDLDKKYFYAAKVKFARNVIIIILLLTLVYYEAGYDGYIGPAIAGIFYLGFLSSYVKNFFKARKCDGVIKETIIKKSETFKNCIRPTSFVEPLILGLMIVAVAIGIIFIG